MHHNPTHHNPTIPKSLRDRAISMPKGVHSLEGMKVINDGKMTVMHPDVAPNRPLFEGNFHIVAFPRAEHIPAFEQAAAGVREHGPASWNPGAIGTTKLYWTLSGANPLLWSSQSHYLVEGNPRLVDPAHGLPWNLVDEYSGWRKRTINHAVNTVIGNGKELVVPYKFFYPQGFDKAMNEHLLREFRSVCGENGLHTRLITDPANPLMTKFVVSRHKG